MWEVLDFKVKWIYENNDLMLLIIIEGIVKDNENEEDNKGTPIEENISILKIKEGDN